MLRAPRGWVKQISYSSDNRARGKRYSPSSSGSGESGESSVSCAMQPSVRRTARSMSRTIVSCKVMSLSPRRSRTTRNSNNSLRAVWVLTTPAYRNGSSESLESRAVIPWPAFEETGDRPRGARNQRFSIEKMLLRNAACSVWKSEPKLSREKLTSEPFRFTRRILFAQACPKKE
jgi:hypothetical protein